MIPPDATPPPPVTAGLPATASERMLLAAIFGLIGLLVLWEWLLAPIRPGGSWLVLKVLPLAASLPGLLRRRPYTRQWLSLLLPLYVAEGIVRAWSEPGRVRAFATAEVVLAVVAFISTIAALRRHRACAAASPTKD